jgi:hypothetical protein
MNAAALAEVRSIVGHGDEADATLRAVVGALVESGGCAWAGILFREQGELVLGPHAGQARTSQRTHVPVVYAGDEVAELVADGAADRELLEHVAELIGAHCLVGWDTGGVPWDPAA